MTHRASVHRPRTVSDMAAVEQYNLCSKRLLLVSFTLMHHLFTRRKKDPLKTAGGSFTCIVYYIYWLVLHQKLLEIQRSSFWKVAIMRWNLQLVRVQGCRLNKKWCS